MKNDTTISVCMITYNHSDYIEEALKGIFSQVFHYNMEVVISNDASTDDTNEKIEKYVNQLPKNPNCEIRYFNHSENLGMMRNFEFALNNCTGKYIALCEGDDYWTDPLKLQKQVDFLEENTDYNICFHPVKIWNESLQHIQNDGITREVSEITDIYDLVQGNFMHTPSVILRNDFNLPGWFKETPQGDWSLYMLMLGKGKIKKINETMAVYRVHEESLWSSKSTEIRQSLTQKSYQLLYDYGNFDDTIRELLYARLNNRIKKTTKHKREYRGKYFFKKILSFFKN